MKAKKIAIEEPKEWRESMSWDALKPRWIKELESV
jgi:hypothetical protein